MSTQCFIRASFATAAVPHKWSSGNNDAKLNGSTSGWNNLFMDTGRGAGIVALITSTVTGPTAGIEVATAGGLPRHFISPPLDADVTIAGTITFNLWALESSMSANVAINCVIDKIDGATGAFTQIVKTARTIELGTAAAAENFTATPTSTACKKGDRLRVRVFGDDAGTMASGFTFSFDTDAASAGVDGDSYVTFTETFGFIITDPTGSQLFPTDTASDVATAAVDREAWTSRGAGVQNDVTNTAAGWTAPIQVTDTAGGTVVDWWTKQLTAFTLGGAVLVNARLLESASAANASWRCEIVVTDSDGSNPVVWAVNAFLSELSMTEAADQMYLSGDDVSVAAGQRLRLRFLLDDPADVPMAAGQTVTLFYAGTTGGASGDTYLTFTQTLTEFISVAAVPRSTPYPQLLAH